MFEFTLDADGFYYEVRHKDYPFLYAKIHENKIKWENRVMSLDDVQTIIREYQNIKCAKPNKHGFCACPKEKQQWMWRPGSVSECGRCGGMLE